MASSSPPSPTYDPTSPNYSPTSPNYSDPLCPEAPAHFYPDMAKALEEPHYWDVDLLFILHSSYCAMNGDVRMLILEYVPGVVTSGTKKVITYPFSSMEQTFMCHKCSKQITVVVPTLPKQPLLMGDTDFKARIASKRSKVNAYKKELKRLKSSPEPTQSQVDLLEHRVRHASIPELFPIATTFFDMGTEAGAKRQKLKYDEAAALVARYEEGCKDGFAMGRRRGHKDGRQAGFDIGESFGYEQGYEAALVARYEEGCKDGFAMGRRRGHKDGRQAGFDIGESFGYKQGYEAAMVECYNMMRYGKGKFKFHPTDLKVEARVAEAFFTGVLHY